MAQFDSEQKNHPNERFGNFLWEIRDGNKIIGIYENLGIFETFPSKPEEKGISYTAFYVKNAILKKMD